MKYENAFADSLQRLRKERGLSRVLVGELCGMSKNMIARYESGERKPSVDALVTLAEFFNVSVDRMLGR